MRQMFDYSNLSSSNYDKLLNAWSQLRLQKNVEFGTSTKYTKEAEASRASIISNFGGL